MESLATISRDGFHNHNHLQGRDQLVRAIDQETPIIKSEQAFFSNIQPQDYIGILANTNLDVITGLYPDALRGMSLLYENQREEPLDLDTVQGFVVRFLERQFFEHGKLIDNDEVTTIVSDVESGKFSLQFDAYLRYRRRLSSRAKHTDKLYGQYVEIKNDDDVLYNKRACLSRVVGIQTLLTTMYGEIDYPKALVTELLLNAPFLHPFIANTPLDQESMRRHEAYIAETVAFAKTFDPETRFLAFDAITQELRTSWTQEIKPPKISPAEKAYLEVMYALSSALLEGSADMESVYALLQQTIVRRGRLFDAQLKQHPDKTNDHFLALGAYEAKSVTFTDIAGYQHQKDYYHLLLEKIASKDPLLKDIRIIIAAGVPGLGKSLGVMAFLNALPENARGYVIKGANTNVYDMLIRLAKLHPELEHFAIIEDIDALAGDRLRYSSTRRFLELDSAIGDAAPGNFHLLATTNRPDVIDPAVIRPGRTNALLMYDYPGKDAVKKIAALHAKSFKVSLSDDALQSMVNECIGFTPDEIKHVIWLMRFHNISEPETKDIQTFAKEIHKHRKLKADLENGNIGFSTSQDAEEYDSEDEFDDPSEEEV